jgi:phosphoglycolate phosphatase
VAPEAAGPQGAGVRVVLFDLDGTLADSAPDLAAAVNHCLVQRGQPELPLAELRPWASHGARGLIGRAFGITPADAAFEGIRDEFLAHYRDNLACHTRLFDGVEAMLGTLEARGMAWGIVTNKVSRLTDPLVQALGLAQRAACVVSGDSAAAAKPDPAPIHFALARSGHAPGEAVYVGDDRRDIVAGRAAGTRTVAAAYGYSAARDPVADWGADHVIAQPLDLVGWLGVHA